MHYIKDVACPQKKDVIFGTIKQALLPLSFQITQETDTTLKLKSSSFFWLKGQNPLMGVSGIAVHVEGQNVQVRANLGGLRNTLWFLLLLLLVVAVSCVVNFSIFMKEAESFQKVLLSLLPFAPWPILAPILFFFMKSRTIRAIDVMLSNMGMSH